MHQRHRIALDRYGFDGAEIGHRPGTHSIQDRDPPVPQRPNRLAVVGELLFDNLLGSGRRGHEVLFVDQVDHLVLVARVDPIWTVGKMRLIGEFWTGVRGQESSGGTRRDERAGRSRSTSTRYTSSTVTPGKQIGPAGAIGGVGRIGQRQKPTSDVGAAKRGGALRPGQVGADLQRHDHRRERRSRSCRPDNS